MQIPYLDHTWIQPYRVYELLFGRMVLSDLLDLIQL